MPGKSRKIRDRPSRPGPNIVMGQDGHPDQFLVFFSLNVSTTFYFKMVSKMSSLGPESLLLPHRIWKVKFVGESVDDCGGGYSESIAEMCDELQVDEMM